MYHAQNTWRLTTMGFADMKIKKPKRIKKVTLAVGASSSIAVFLAGYLTQWLKIPEYTTEVTAILTALIGIAAGLLQPHHPD